MLCEKHGLKATRCGKCLLKKDWPRGMKKCRCGLLIWKEQVTCARCHAHEEAIWTDYARHDHRRMVHDLIVRLNH